MSPLRLLLMGLGAALALQMAAAQEVRAPVANTALGRLAAELAPGEFRRLNASLPGGVERFASLLGGVRPDGRPAPAIDTWTDSAQWDPSRQRVFFQGLRISNRFLSYHAQGNHWEEISLEVPDAPPRFERFGHLYGRTALDRRRGHFYRLVGSTLHRYVIDEQRWEAFPGAPIGSYISIGWHEALDQLVGTDNHGVHGFRDGHWQPLGRTAVHGYHSSSRYNPRRKDMLFIGGNESRRTVDLLTADGAIKHMRDAPFDFTIRADDLTYDPVSGRYLVLLRDRTLWEYDADRDEWHLARDMRGAAQGWPFGSGGIVPVPIDELGIVFWIMQNGALLYRHRSASLTRPEPVPPAPREPRPVPPRTVAEAPVLAPVPQPAKSTQPSGPGLIEREAATLQPGEWRNLAHLTTWEGKDRGVSFKGFQTVRRMDGVKGGADGMGWTQALVYHRGRLMLLLMRDAFERALLVMEPDGRFLRIDQPPGFDQKSHRRPFNKLTQDDRYLYFSPNIGRDKLGQMIRTPLDDPGVFEPFGIPIGDSQILGQFAATYVPEWKRFYAYTPGGKIWSWAPGEAAWRQHARLPADENGYRLSGYAGLLLWNPVRRELVIAGGQTFGNSPQTSHKVYRITSPDGAPEMLPDRRFPDGSLMPWGSGSSRMLADPRDGSYLLLTPEFIYRHGCAGGRFELYEDLRETRPFGNYEAYTPLAVIPGTDVVVFLSHIKGLVLHRLRPVAPPSPDC